ncbi:MAG: DUF1957 domain-containing protein [Treponema sp.]|jgi:1,4-alpha-glucan branching enzyme|nr:DUF1957 domain-containing protein [Treponema sp.]
MESRYAASIVLEAHLPFVNGYSREEPLLQTEVFTAEEIDFFETISETLLPLLEVLDRLESNFIPFRLALVLSPVLCQMLCNENLQNKYLHYIDKQLEFGKHELEKRTVDQPEINKLAEIYYNKIIDRRIVYTERYDKNIIKAFDFYRRRGKLEILASCATHSFLPLIGQNPESIQAQMETPISIYRKNFGSTPQGFWLPCFGWTGAVEPFLRAYNYSYTILETHGLLFGQPTPEKGCFYPVKTHGGTYILGRDYYSLCEIEKISNNKVYRNNNLDAGYELSPKLVKQFLSAEGERRKTGYKYLSKETDTVYNPEAASAMIQDHARMFLEKTINRLEEASKHMKEPPLCLYANNADNFGRFWHEGFNFLETLFRMASYYRDFQFINPSEYIYKQNPSSLQVVSPEFSSNGKNGYAESWLNDSNDQLFSHLVRAMERMTELAERFPDDTGLKERALNQAAREILLAQSSDGLQTEVCLRNFTTVYEALGSNYISTEWLTTMEKKHNLFPNINYRMFRRKK